MKSCIVKAHRAGLWSMINNVMSCLCDHDHVHVDWTNGTSYSPPGFDLWSELFDPTQPTDDPHEIIEGYRDQWLTYKNAGTLYQSGDGWRHRLRTEWERLTPKKSRHLEAPQCHATTSVLVRAHCHAGEQLSNRSQAFDEYAAAIEREIKGRYHFVYLATGDMETLDWFRSRFSVIYHPGTRRTDTRNEDQFAMIQTPNDAVICFQEVMLMSRADVFIHPVSNMSTGALYINPRMKSVFLP